MGILFVNFKASGKMKNKILSENVFTITVKV